MNKKFVGGCCGIFALIVVGVIAFAVVRGPSVLRQGKAWAEAKIGEAKHEMDRGSAWQPPSAAPDGSWFPQKVGTWRLSTNEDIAGLPELELDRTGRRGLYRGASQDVTVTVVAATPLERDGIFTRAKAALEKGNTRTMNKSGNGVSVNVESHGSRVTTQTPNRLYVQLDGTEHTRLWWLKGWLFIFHTRGMEDPDEFAGRYLEAMGPPELEKR